MAVALTPFEAFVKAIDLAGGQSALARGVGCTQGSISQRLKKKLPISHRHVIKAEELTGVPKEQLRPDIYPPADRRALDRDHDGSSDWEPAR